MKRSTRMEPVAEVAGHREQQEAQRLGGCQRQLDEEENKLRQLIAYREEYAGRLNGQQGMDAVLLRDFRVFLERLNQAIDQQRQRVEQARQACERQRLQWLASRSRAQALDKVTARYRAQERREEERAEQAELDDRAQRGGSEEW